MNKAEIPNRLIQDAFSSNNDYQAYLKTVPDANLQDAAITLRINESDVKQRLKSINSELRRRQKKAAHDAETSQAAGAEQ